MPSVTQEYGEGRGPIPAIEDPTIIFVINRSLGQATPTDQDVYRATRCCWVIGEDARNHAVFALGVSHGVVRGAYRIEGWHRQEGNRWAFDGCPAPELNAVGTSVAKLKAPQGAANPVRLFLDGVPE